MPVSLPVFPRCCCASASSVAIYFSFCSRFSFHQIILHAFNRFVRKFRLISVARFFLISAFLIRALLLFVLFSLTSRIILVVILVLILILILVLILIFLVIFLLIRILFLFILQSTNCL